VPAIRQWLREHPGETFTTIEIAASCGLRRAAVAAVLRDHADDGVFPGLARVGKSTWSVGKPPGEGEYRVTREAPLRTGARLEVIGQDRGGTVVVRDGSGRLWVLRPLELPA
jgi:hypothetical protein